tara:strand:+ start:493 stop:747 length:255 start_codon:yes stop_codon:yes gene_type:complete
MEVGSLGLQGGYLWPKEAMTFDGRFECRFTYSLELHTRMKKGIQNSNSRNGENNNLKSFHGSLDLEASQNRGLSERAKLQRWNR